MKTKQFTFTEKYVNRPAVEIRHAALNELALSYLNGETSREKLITAIILELFVYYDQNYCIQLDNIQIEWALTISGNDLEGFEVERVELYKTGTDEILDALFPDELDYITGIVYEEIEAEFNDL